MTAAEGGLVLGSARCGSTLVSRILRAHPDVLSLSELFATAGPHAFRPSRLSGRRFWDRLATPSRAFSAVANPVAAPGEFLYADVPDPAHDPWRCPPILAVTLPHVTDEPDALFAALAREVPGWGARDLPGHYRALFAAISRHLGGRRVWVERSGGSLIAAGTLREAFPEARRLVLLRDGADTALSMRDFPAARVAIRTWARLRPFGIDLLGARGHYGRGAAWPIVAALGGLGAVRRAARTRPSLAECGAFWSAVMRAGLPRLDGGPAPLAVRYEALCRDPRLQIERLGRHLAGTAPEGWLAAVEGMPRPRPSRAATLRPAELSELETACAPGEDAVETWLRTTGRHSTS